MVWKLYFVVLVLHFCTCQSRNNSRNSSGGGRFGGGVLTVEDAVRLLETGERKSGPLRPPMPEFRFNHQDAVDAVAYLKSLGQKECMFIAR